MLPTTSANVLRSCLALALLMLANPAHSELAASEAAPTAAAAPAPAEAVRAVPAVENAVVKVFATVR